MKLIKHDRRPTINSIVLRSNPLSIWLGTRTELRIKRGDKLEDVANMIMKHGQWSVNYPTARKIVAYWFALGERVASKRLGTKWRTKEFDSDPARVYRG